MPAQRPGGIPAGVSKASVRRTDVDKKWLDELPQFCDSGLVARLFGVSAASARRWMRGEDAILPSALRPDNRYVTARVYVIALAQKLYGEMERS